MGFFQWFKKRPEGDVKASPVEEAYSKIDDFLGNEDAQNQRCPENILALMKEGGAMDRVPNGIGEFGRDRRNPIPVNGPLGELVYLSSLLTSAGAHVVAHRLGSIQHSDAKEKYMDLFEIVSLDGSKWDLLFFDMYHTRKSNLLPSGYRRAAMTFIYATNNLVPDFPASISEALIEVSKKCIGFPLRDRQVWDAARHSRPREHELLLKSLLSSHPNDLPQSFLPSSPEEDRPAAVMDSGEESVGIRGLCRECYGAMESEIALCPHCHRPNTYGEVKSDLRKVFFEGKKVDAIRKIRELTGLGVAEATRIVDSWHVHRE